MSIYDSCVTSQTRTHYCTRTKKKVPIRRIAKKIEGAEPTDLIIVGLAYVPNSLFNQSRIESFPPGISHRDNGRKRKYR
jgi:hypothetical protein